MCYAEVNLFCSLEHSFSFPFSGGEKRRCLTVPGLPSGQSLEHVVQAKLLFHTMCIISGVGEWLIWSWIPKCVKPPHSHHNFFSSSVFFCWIRMRSLFICAVALVLIPRLSSVIYQWVVWCLSLTKIENNLRWGLIFILSTTLWIGFV